MLIVSLILFIACVGCDAVICPDECFCENLVANCSSRNLFAIPTGLSLRTKELYLDNNNINSLEHQYTTRNQRLSELKLLDLRYNNISILPSKVFEHFRQLSVIYLDHNNIAFHDDHLHPFDELHWTLLHLSLSYNSITDFVDIAHLSTLDEVQFLNLSHNQISSIRDNSLPPSIIQLDLSYNPITILSPSNLYWHPHLIYLDLLEVEMSALQSGVFQHIVTLQTLRIGGPHLTNLTNSVFIGLSSLNRLEIVNTNISFFPVDLFQHCPNITILNLSYNRFGMFSPELFRFTPALTQLLIKANLLSDSDAIASQLQHLTLQHLDLESNLIEGSFFSILRAQSNLRTLILAKNRLETISDPLSSSSLETLDLSFNFITSIRRNAFIGCSSLKDLILSGNKLQKLPSNLRVVNPLNVFIYDNPWHCNCEFYRSVESEATNLADDDLQFKCSAGGSLSCLRCASPSALKGIAAQDLTPEQLNSCSVSSVINTSTPSVNIIIYVAVLVTIAVFGFACIVYIKKEFFRDLLERRKDNTDRRRRERSHNLSQITVQTFASVTDVEAGQQTELMVLSQTCNSEPANNSCRSGSCKSSSSLSHTGYCEECAGNAHNLEKKQYRTKETCSVTEKGDFLYDSQLLPQAVHLLADTSPDISLSKSTAKHNNNNNEIVL